MRHLTALLAICPILNTPFLYAGDYCVVVNAATYEDPSWKAVADTLVRKHDGRLLTYKSSPTEVLGQLCQDHPRYTCFVSTRDEAGREFVAAVHQLTRKLDDDPYTDTFWGILTGYDAANALAIATYRDPLTVRKVASGTEIALEMCEQGLWYDELVKNKLVQKQKGGSVQQLQGPDDTTEGSCQFSRKDEYSS